MYLYTDPEVAKNILLYRYKTLPEAKKKAERLGYQGAFFAWTSGETGEELFPDFFFTDVYSGRKVRNYFNSRQIHISPDIVYAVVRYYEISGDLEFMLNYGMEVVFEVAKFVASRGVHRFDRDQFEILQVIGPDEYHEHVDNNTYTNYMCKYVLDHACSFYDSLANEHHEKFNELTSRIDINQHSRTLWGNLAENIFLPQACNHTKLIEQFEGYFKLEDTRPDKLRQRINNNEEYWGFPNGVAVHTQVIKQPDIVQLFALFNTFPIEVMRTNFNYYEPRCEHGSSLSPASHAIVAAKCGLIQEAYDYFKQASTIDLYARGKKKVSGGEFLGGIHTAAAAGVWWLLAEGFAGISVTANNLRLRPTIPDCWDKYTLPISLQDSNILITITPDCVSIEAQNAPSEPLHIEIFGVTKILSHQVTLCWRKGENEEINEYTDRKGCV